MNIGRSKNVESKNVETKNITNVKTQTSKYASVEIYCYFPFSTYVVVRLFHNLIFLSFILFTFLPCTEVQIACQNPTG